MQTQVPNGYILSSLDEGFLNLIGPLYEKVGKENRTTFAIRATEDHVNRYGVVHGGLLATLVDVAIGVNLNRVGGQDAESFTLNLSLDFVGHANKGEWIEGSVVLTKEGGRVRFGECHVTVDGRIIARSSAVFYVKKAQPV